MDDDTKEKLKGLGLAVGFILLFGLLAYCVVKRPATYREAYSAYVLEKRIRILESDNGGLVAWYLIVQDLHDERFIVRVSDKIFHQAQPGAFIEKRATDKDPTISP